MVCVPPRPPTPCLSGDPFSASHPACGSFPFSSVIHEGEKCMGGGELVSLEDPHHLGFPTTCKCLRHGGDSALSWETATIVQKPGLQPSATGPPFFAAPLPESHNPKQLVDVVDQRWWEWPELTIPCNHCAVLLATGGGGKRWCP